MSEQLTERNLIYAQVSFCWPCMTFPGAFSGYVGCPVSLKYQCLCRKVPVSVTRRMLYAELVLCVILILKIKFLDLHKASPGLTEQVLGMGMWYAVLCRPGWVKDPEQMENRAFRGTSTSILFLISQILCDILHIKCIKWCNGFLSGWLIYVYMLTMISKQNELHCGAETNLSVTEA